MYETSNWNKNGEDVCLPIQFLNLSQSGFLVLVHHGGQQTPCTPGKRIQMHDFCKPIPIQ